jgi:Phosphodiester glycosidase
MRIVPTQANFPPTGPPASFAVDTGGARWFAVQVTTEATLLNGALASRRTPANFFDSWVGDDAWPAGGTRPPPRQVAGQRLEAPTGRSRYTLPAAVWRRFARANRLFYRLLVSDNAGLRSPTPSIPDVDWKRAPSVSVASAPAQPTRAPVARFRGKGVLARPDLLTSIQPQISKAGLVSGRDGDFSYAFLDAKRFRMVVVECHERGLTDTVTAMPRKPTAVINGQFLGGSTGIGINTEGEVVREGRLINRDRHPTRWYLAQTRENAGAAHRVGTGDPSTSEPTARAAFGGLGPVLTGGTPPASLTPWARSIYARPRGVGRGVVAIHRQANLVLLLVQRDLSLPWQRVGNAMTLAELRDVLQALGFNDAVFNDGSDSESLFARGGWLLEPGTVKDEAMDFAIGFVDDRAVRVARVLVVDGTESKDGVALARGLERPAATAYAPRNVADDLRGLAANAPIAAAFQHGVLQADLVSSNAGIARMRQVVAGAGAGPANVDLLYVSSHASRHGNLWYHPKAAPSSEVTIANPWSPGFRPSWASVRWLVIAGCSVLGLRYTRGRRLTPAERTTLVSLHQAIHGPGAAVPGLTPATRTVFVAYHPGWAWYDRVLKHLPGLRGVLGYWYRSPGEGRDVEIIDEFTERLKAGERLLDAWNEANQRGVFELAALWAAMVRRDCTTDTIATLEDRTLRQPQGEWLYYDRFQAGRSLPLAYATANRLGGRTTIGGVTLKVNDDYDEPAIDELEDLPVAPGTHLVYDDGVGPPGGGRGGR